MRILLILLLSLPISCRAQHYKITWEKAGAWATFAASGALHGGREAYHADPYIFQKHFGGGAQSWWGPEQWKRQYRNNDPDQPHKWNGLNAARDYWHFSHVAGQYSRDAAVFMIGNSRQPMKFKLLDLFIGFTISSTASWATYNYLRQK